jgi:hypothetical protein
MKPQVLLDYNKRKQIMDLSDQLSAYYTYLRRSTKWYQKVAFELIFGTAIVNTYLIYKENYATSDMVILQFRENLVQSLLLGMPFDKLKPGPRQQSASYSKYKLADHKLEEKEGPARIVRRHCANCNEKIREHQEKRVMRQQR